MDDLYRDYILDHYKRPRNFGELEPHDLEALEHNPLCGDELGVHIGVKDGRIEDLRFHGHGCAISQASASIASEELKGMDAGRGRQARRRLDDRAARHSRLGDAAQVRAAQPEGRARRRHRRQRLAVVSGRYPDPSAPRNAGARSVDPDTRDTIPTSAHRIRRSPSALDSQAPGKEPHGND